MTENTRFQNRIEGMNLDKLDGKIPVADFEQKTAKWRAEQDRLQGSIEEHLAANHYQLYLQEGVRLLKLAQCAHELSRRQEPREQRRLLNFVLSNRTWMDKEHRATFRQLFDIIADSNVSHGHKKRPPETPPTAFLMTGSPGRIRTSDQVVNSHSLCRLSYRGTNTSLH